MRFAPTLLMLALVAAGPALAQPGAGQWADLFPEFAGAPQAGMPLTLTDGGAQLWDIQADGSVSNGTGDAFDGAMYLEINGGAPSFGAPALLLEGGRELAFVPASSTAGLWVGRRVWVPSDQSYARWLDVLYNPGEAAVTVTVGYRVGLGSDGETEVVSRRGQDELSSGELHGWVTDDRAPNGGDPAVAVIFGDGAAPVTGTPTLQAGHDTPSIVFTVEVPPATPVALAVYVAQRANRPEAVEWLQSFEPTEGMGRLPYRVENFAGFGGAAALRYSGLIRGQDSDVIQLQGGNRVKGTLENEHWTIATRHGEYSLTREEIAGIVLGEGATGEDAMILLDGQILVGELRGGPVVLTLESGLKLKPALKKVARIGFAVREGEEAALQATGDIAVLRSGDRLRGTIVADRFELATVYGTVEIPRDRVAIVDLLADGGATHRITTADGSTFSGVLLQQTLEFQRGEGEPLSLDHRQLASLEVPALLIEPAVDAGAPVVELVNGDVWYARPTGGELALAADFGPLQVELDQIRSITADPRSPGAFLVVLAGGDRLAARPAADTVAWKLTCGLQHELPAIFLRRITVPASNAPTRRPGTLPIRLGGP
jgi:hypothetical protein